MCLSFYFTKNYSIIVYDCSIIYKLIFHEAEWLRITQSYSISFTFKNQKIVGIWKVLNIKNDAILMVYEWIHKFLKCIKFVEACKQWKY